MPEEKTELAPSDVPVDTAPVVAAPVDALPDNAPDENADKIKAIESEKVALAEKLNAVAKEKDELAQRLKDNQEYISRTRKVEPAKTEVLLPRQSFEDYKESVKKIFRDDPEKGLDKLITDVAYDRDLERQEYDKRIAEAETNAFKRILKLDPEKAKTMQAVEKLEQERPDLAAALNFDQKLEWVRMAEGVSRPQPVSRAQVDREHVLSSDVGGGRGGRPDRMPAWASDPAVMRDAQGHFGSKQEMIDWANVTTNEDAKRLLAKRGQV
jgi:hypothetical protein